MIVLKHLAQEFDLDPYKLRKMLRPEFGYHRRWQWENDNDPELKRIRKFLSSGGSSSTSRTSSE